MRKWLYIAFLACLLVGCKEYQVSDDASLRLSFSCDTLCFDTVFTEQGSATAQDKANMIIALAKHKAIRIAQLYINGILFHNADGIELK